MKVMKAKELFTNNGELSHKTRTIKDLIRFIETRENEDTSNYSLLLGAGASSRSGISTASELIDKWKLELYERFESSPFIKDNNFENINDYFEKKHANWYNSFNPYSSLFEKKFDLPAQRRRFVEKEVSGKLPSIGYAYLISLVEKNFFNTIFTTNFDDLLNESFYQLSTTRPIICAHDSSVHSISITSKRPKILKLHGDYLFEDIKSTLRETESLEQNIKDKLIEFCKEFGLIVIGYSGCDRSVMDVLDYLVKRDNYLKNGLYWCFRENDEINQNVKNLLWKDRVYPVIIDGFDELFAEIHYSLTKKLGQLFRLNKETTQDKIAKNIISSNYQNDIIQKEIEEMSRNRDMIDISNFINNGEYNYKKERLNLKNLRNLLEVSELSRNNPDEAYNKCKSYLENLTSSSDREKFLKKLIELCRLLNKRSDSLFWAKKLVELDINNPENNLIKIDCIEDINQQDKEINELSQRLDNSYSIYNKHIRILFKILEKNDITQENIKDILLKIERCIEKSIKLNPSLSNYVFLHKHKLLSYKLDNIYLFHNSKDQLKTIEKIEEDIRELLKNVELMNKYHPAYIYLREAESERLNKIYSYRELIETCYDVIKKQEIDVIKQTNDIINKALINYLNAEDSDGYCKLHEDFYKKVNLEENSGYSCGCIINKALYHFLIEKNKEDAINLIRKALEHDDINDDLDLLIEASSIIDKEVLNDIEKHVQRIKPILREEYYINLLCNLYGENKNYEQNLEYLEKLYSISNNLKIYANNKSFLLLKLERYQDLIDFYNKDLDKTQGSDFNILKINVLIAKKKISHQDIDLEIREVLSKTKDKLENIVLTILLDENTEQSYDRLNNLISINPRLYYQIKDWVVIDLGKIKYQPL